MNRRLTTSFLITALLGAILASPGTSGPAGTVGVKLTEFKLVPSVKSAPSGSVTFLTRNAGTLTHELVVLKTTRAAGKLPTRGMQAVEKGRVGQLTVLAPGTTKKLTLKLGAGHYALICNIPGHYKAGQFADFTVR